MKIQKKKAEVKSGVNPLVAAVSGIVVGAGIAAAGAFALGVENREKIKNVANDAKDKITKAKESITT